ARCIWSFHGNHSYSRWASGRPDGSETFAHHRMDSWTRFDISDGTCRSPAFFSGRFVWLRLDRLRSLTFEQLRDRGARYTINRDCALSDNRYIWDGYGARARNWRMDWRPLWNAHELFDRRWNICPLKRFHIIYRSSAHRSS